MSDVRPSDKPVEIRRALEAAARELNEVVATAGAHAANHVTSGTDKIRDATNAQDGLMTAALVTDLEAVIAALVVDIQDLIDHEADTGNPHETDIANLGASTLLDLNTLLSTTIDESGDSRPPSTHNHTAAEVTSGELALAQGGMNADATSFTNSQLLQKNAGGTAMESSGKTIADFVEKSLFDADTILAADSDNTPAALTVPVQTLVGRITAGNIDALTAPEARTLLNVADGADVTPAAATQHFHSFHLVDPQIGDEYILFNAGNAQTITRVGHYRVAGTTCSFNLRVRAEGSAHTSTSETDVFASVKSAATTITAETSGWSDNTIDQYSWCVLEITNVVSTVTDLYITIMSEDT